VYISGAGRFGDWPFKLQILLLVLTLAPSGDGSLLVSCQEHADPVPCVHWASGVLFQYKKETEIKMLVS